MPSPMERLLFVTQKSIVHYSLREMYFELKINTKYGKKVDRTDRQSEENLMYSFNWLMDFVYIH